LRDLPTRYPRHQDFPRSGMSGHAHVEFVFAHICRLLDIDPSGFKLRQQEDAIDPHLGNMALVVNAPRDPAGTYSTEANHHLITYDPAAARDLEQLIAILAHEVGHALLNSIEVRPDGWDENEEFATDLAAVFLGFGIFGGNQSFQFAQFRDASTGTEGWATRRLGYLTQNEWGYALALRSHLTGEDISPIEKYSSDSLFANFKKNYRYLSKNREKIAALLK
jgi:hypothetical protein